MCRACFLTSTISLRLLFCFYLLSIIFVTSFNPYQRLLVVTRMPFNRWIIAAQPINKLRVLPINQLGRLQCSQKMQNIFKSKWNFFLFSRVSTSYSFPFANVISLITTTKTTKHLKWILQLKENLQLIYTFVMKLQTFERRQYWTPSHWECANHQLYIRGHCVQWARRSDAWKIEGKSFF